MPTTEEYLAQLEREAAEKAARETPPTHLRQYAEGLSADEIRDLDLAERKEAEDARARRAEDHNIAAADARGRYRGP